MVPNIKITPMQPVIYNSDIDSNVFYPSIDVTFEWPRINRCNYFVFEVGLSYAAAQGEIVNG